MTLLAGSVEVAGPLQQANVVVLTQEECRAEWGDIITDGMICVGGGGNVGACKVKHDFYRTIVQPFRTI